MGMKKQSSVGRVVHKRGVHPRPVCVKSSLLLTKFKLKSKSTKLPLGIRLSRAKKEIVLSAFRVNMSI